MNAGVVVLLAVLAVGAAGGGLAEPAPPPATAGGTAGYATLAALAGRAGFPPAHQDDLVAIAMAESSGRLGVVSAPNSDGTRDRCAWQINDVHGYDRSRLVTDPAYCATAAKQVYDLQGLGAWTVYDSGAYQTYLPRARAAVAGEPDA